MAPPRSPSSNSSQLSFPSMAPPAAVTSPQQAPNSRLSGDGSASDAHGSVGSLTGGSGKEEMRMFDPRKSLKHHDVPDDLLLAFNRENKVVHLRGRNNSTGAIETDPLTLVVSIDVVVYQDGQAGAAVFFHPDSPWNTVTLVESSEKDAKMQALYVALEVICSTTIRGPRPTAVYIRCTGTEFCLAMATGALEQSSLGGESVSKWAQGADRTELHRLGALWEEMAGGLDVYLWPVDADKIEPVTELATACMSKRYGRDWGRENGKQGGRFEVDISSYLNAGSEGDIVVIAAEALGDDLEGYSIVAPQHIIALGPHSVTRWEAETKATLHRCVLFSMVLSNACNVIVKNLQGENGNAEPIQPEAFVEAYEMAMELTLLKECFQQHLHDFIAEQHAIRTEANVPVGDGWDCQAMLKLSMVKPFQQLEEIVQGVRHRSGSPQL